ncbi:hypothetical protein HMPREF1129_0412 [Actinomyces naeslundii str. Howell 279]|uniref:Uncharacterized protein n=1 Tax=Actinomyces naeslundii (strain ATCC 12104 / DSM 43013 / CCUG 2238 / JCM 8349 / NCTC 10301 / Howell 279) TaxID=1115803 RepID=J3JIX9_ACTNH|nr:hypothetical protein HMPREF1129_0412 [Actinomyces naeslundii str. Howell 279]
MLTAVVGAIFAPVTSVLLGLADAAPTQILRTALLLSAILLLSASAAALFASRSSLGALVAGLTALAAQSMVFLAPIHAASLSEKWLQSLIRTGFVLVLAGLWLGGSWGMRQARRAGHAQGHAAFRLTQADRTVGSTPTPPPRAGATTSCPCPGWWPGWRSQPSCCPVPTCERLPPASRPGR